MILSASGWRKVFAISGDEQDRNPEISENDKKIAVTAANVFSPFFLITLKKSVVKKSLLYP